MRTLPSSKYINKILSWRLFQHIIFWTAVLVCRFCLIDFCSEQVISSLCGSLRKGLIREVTSAASGGDLASSNVFAGTKGGITLLQLL